MTLRSIIALLFLALSPLAPAQVQLEKPKNPAPSTQTSSPAAEVPAPLPPIPAPTPTYPMPPPPEPPPAQSPVGLLILAVLLAHVCLPLGMIIGIVLLLIVIRFFRGGLMKLVMGVAATGGGAKAIRSILIVIGCFIVLPSGFMGLNWASRWMDYRVSGLTWWIYGLVVAVVTGLVFFTLMKAIASAVKKKMMGRMGGLAGMMGGMGGMGGFGGMMGGGRDLPGDRRRKKRR